MEKDDQVNREPNEVSGLEEYEGTVDIGFGEIFKKYREDAGYTITQLADATKILVSFIEALEKEDFEVLPGIVFGRGFTKSICKVLGVESTAVLELYDKAAKQYQEKKSGLKTQTKESLASVKLQSERSNSVFEQALKILSPKALLKSVTPIGLAGAIGAVLVVVIILFAGIRALKPAKNLEETPKQDMVQVEQTKTEETAAKEPESEDAANSESTITDEQQSEQTAQNTESSQTEETVNEVATQIEATSSGEQLLEIQATKPVKVRMSVDNGAWTTNTLNPDNHQFRFKDSLHLLVFDASAVKMSFNGKPLGTLGKEGRVRRLTFMAKSDDSSKNKKM